MTARPVTWSTSQLRAEAHMRRADELLEARRWSEAMDELAAAQREIATTAEFVVALLHQTGDRASG